MCMTSDCCCVLYIPVAKVGIECAEPTVEWACCPSSLHTEVYVGGGAGEGGSNPDAVDRSNSFGQAL